MQFVTNTVPSRQELVDLYDAVGWTTYTDDPEALERAAHNSTFVVTAIDNDLVGLARVISDDVSILYIQDLLVRPSHQRQGIGRRLLDTCLKRFPHVRQRMLLTDNEPHQHRLYRQAGFHDVSKLTNVALHAFVSIRGTRLKSRAE